MKTHTIKVTVTKETKDKLISKCKESGLTLTAFIEKVSNEPIVFLDKNVQSLISLLEPIIHQNVKKK